MDSKIEVAVIGMACRLPGRNNSPAELWESILNKVDASGPLPEGRWDTYMKRDERNRECLRNTTSRGYFLDNLFHFDASFFGISPKEAEQMDPQQRLALEVAWEALENAGISPNKISGSDTAVFMGVNSDDYARIILEDLPGIEPWMGIGTAYCGVANRISYQLNLMGPSAAVDAACASSLVAIHQGQQAILNGESNIAITGGVNAMCGPGMTAMLDKAGALSPDGRCRSFDDAADGYGRGEGAAVVILKDMASAIHDGDEILAVLKGSAVAHDGRTNGIMAPNKTAQELVMRSALRRAGIDPATVDYIEAHATSTSLGDPVEVSAIASVYGSCRPKDQPCRLGSVKPNVGHLEAGAGVVGFMKAVMAVRNGVLPPQANLKTPNSKICWESSGVTTGTNEDAWMRADTPHRAGICSYGYGGTVSHAIIEEYVKPSSLDHVDMRKERYQMLLLSAPQGGRLMVEAGALANWFSTSGLSEDLASIASTLAVHRAHHKYRAAFIVDTHEAATEKLTAFAKGIPPEDTITGEVVHQVDQTLREVVWVFSGQGSQWEDMGIELVHNPEFRTATESIDRIVREELGFSALEALAAGEPAASYQTQVMIYVIQIGVSAILQAKGMSCDAVIGHSVGEVAAAVIAGCISAEEGALIVTKRAKLYRSFAGRGAMLLVTLSSSRMEEYLSEESSLAIAIHASPTSCVVAGLKEEIQQLDDKLKATLVRTFRVKTDIAYHHPMLCEISLALEESLQGHIHPKPPLIPIYSTSQDDARSPHSRDISYWTANMIRPVQFSLAVATAANDGFRMFLEVSPHPIVASSIQEALYEMGIGHSRVVGTMARATSPERSILCGLAQLYCQGARVNWRLAMSHKWATNVPRTTWRHKVYNKAVEARPGLVDSPSFCTTKPYTLLGQRTDVAGKDIAVYSTMINESRKPFPGTHPVHGCEIVPAAVLLHTFLCAADTRALSDVHLRNPVPTKQSREIQAIVQDDEIHLFSRSTVEQNGDECESGWVTHTTGIWGAELDSIDCSAIIDADCVKRRIGATLPNNFSVDYLANLGVSSMGFPWSVVEQLGNGEEMLAYVDATMNSTPGMGLTTSWSCILDAATSIGSTIFAAEPRLRMPAHVKHVRLYATEDPPRSVVMHVRREHQDGDVCSISICNMEGQVLMLIESMKFAEMESRLQQSPDVDDLVYQVSWPPARYSQVPLSIKHVIMVSRDAKLARDVIAPVQSRLQSTTIVRSPYELTRVIETRRDESRRTDTAVVYLPVYAASFEPVCETAQRFSMDVLDIVKPLATLSEMKVFVLTNASVASDQRSLAHTVLHGLSRIIMAELPHIWGGLIDLEEPRFPLEIMKYVQGADMIRIEDGIPRVARLRPLSPESGAPLRCQGSLLPNTSGTYLITGGLGSLGLEIAEFLVQQGARSIVLVSRRTIPQRDEWAGLADSPSSWGPIIRKMKHLESSGATIKTIAIDIASPDAESKLSAAIADHSLPPVQGVIHAAGVLDNELVLAATPEAFKRVLLPKVAGAQCLHQMYPPGTLDFMVLFSSCGQLLGFPGQASYASANAFLDGLAAKRQALGDNTVSIQWTSWRGMGMSISSEFIDAELANKGIGDVTSHEAFEAWKHISKYNISEAAVLRVLPLNAHEPLPSPILSDVVQREVDSDSGCSSSRSTPLNSDSSMTSIRTDSQSTEEQVKECVSSVLQMDVEEIDINEPLSNMGVDSVMTGRLRGQLQKCLHILVPPTITWTHPTVKELAQWCTEEAQPAA